MKSLFVINPVVLIPVHKELPSKEESISIKNSGCVLRKHNIFYLCPSSLNLDVYLGLIPTAGQLRVDNHWMNSLRDYNKMMISPMIFKALHEYSHILICEPDAIAISDQLEYWCSRGFSYIGAPWFSGYYNSKANQQPVAVGNSGFSLLRRDHFLAVLTSPTNWYSFPAMAKDLLESLSSSNNNLHQRAISGIINGRSFVSAYKTYWDNCDIFWSKVIPKYFPWFRIPSPDLALRFAWEMHPQSCHILNRGNLPFGIHAWYKYDYTFLRPLLKDAGVNFTD